MDGNGDIIHRNGGGEKVTAEKHSNSKSTFLLIDGR